MGLWHATVAEYVRMKYIFHSWSSAGISVGSTPAMQALWCKMYIIRHSHSAFYTMFVLGTINAVVNLKQVYLCKN